MVLLLKGFLSSNGGGSVTRTKRLLKVRRYGAADFCKTVQTRSASPPETRPAGDNQAGFSP
jgi:hypothetical protein